MNVPISEITGHARRHRQLADPDLDQADPHDRWLRAALLGLQLLRTDRLQRDQLIIIRKRQGEVEY